jgi:sulfoxide reductase heme-binding subunit YedZ
VPFSPLEVVVPFMGPYRPLWVGIGQIAMGLTIVVLVSFYVRKRIGQKTWRRVHYLSFLAFVAATVHGLMAGTDSQSTWALAGYILATSIVVLLLAYRIATSVAARRRQGASPAAASPAAAAPGSANRSASIRQAASGQSV